MVRAITDIDLLQTEMDAREDAEGAPQVLRSASAGAENLIGSLHGAVGAGARAVGLDSIADAADRRADHRLTRSQIVRGNVPSFSESDSIGDYATWATDMLAGNAPLMAATAASGGLAGVGARVAGLGARGAGIAQGVGAAVPYGSTAVAEDYAQLRHDPNAEGTPQEQAQASILSGAVKTALGLGPLGNAKKLLGSGAGIGKTLGVTAAGEGVTEAGEQAISRFTRGQFNEDINLFDAEARAEYIEAALGGALVGTGYSGIGAVARNFLGGQQAGDTAAAKAARAPTFNTDNERLSYMQAIQNVLTTEQPADNQIRDGAWRELTRVGNQMGEAKYSDMARQIIDGVRTAGLMPAAERDTNIAAEASRVNEFIGALYEGTQGLDALEQTRSAKAAAAQANADMAEFSDIVDSDPVDFTGLTDVEVGQSDYQGGPSGRPYVVATGGVTDTKLNKMRQFDPDSDYQVMSMASAAAEQWEASPTTARRGKLVSSAENRGETTAELNALRGEMEELQRIKAKSEKREELHQKIERVTWQIRQLDPDPADPAFNTELKDRLEEGLNKLESDLSVLGKPEPYNAERMAEVQGQAQKMEGEIARFSVKKFSPGGDEVMVGRDAYLAEEANKLWQSYGDKAREKLGRFVEADRKAYNDEVAANEARRTDLMNQLEGTEFGSAEADAIVEQLETADARVTPPAERFLSHFSVVRRTPKSIDAMPDRGNISFTLEELMSERNNKGGRAPVISARAKPRNAEKGVVREIPIDTANGPMMVDAVNLTNMMMKKLRGSQVGGGGSTREKAAVAFATGMSSILENPSVRGGFTGLNDNTVIWRPAGKGKPLTVKDARSVRDANHGLFQQISRAEAELNVLRETWRNNPETRARTEELAKEQQAIINSAAEKIDGKTDLSPKKYRDAVDELAAAEEEMAELQRIAGENDTREFNARRIDEIQEELANPQAESDIAQLQADLTGLDNAQYGLGQAEPLNRKRFGELQGEIANLRQLARRNDERVEGFAQPVRDIQGENEVDSGIVQPTEMKPRFNPDQGRTQGGENESLVNNFERRVGYYDDATTRPAKEGPKLYGNPAQGEKTAPKIGETPVSDIPPKQGKRGQDFVNALSETMGINAPKSVESDEMVARLRAAGETIMAQDLEAGNLRGVSLSEGGDVVWVNPHLSDAQYVEVMAHELGHKVMKDAFMNADKEVKVEVIDEFKAWHEESKGRSTADVIRSRGGVTETTAEGFDREYAMDFEEWFADNVMRWATTAATPRTVVEKFFAGVVKVLKKAIREFNKVLRNKGLPEYGPADSIHDFMDAQAKSAKDKQFTHADVSMAQDYAQAPPDAEARAGAETAAESGSTEQERAEQFSESVEQGAGGFMGSLRSWATALQGGRRAVLSSRMIQAINQHIGLHMSEAEYEVLRKAADGGYAQRAMRNALRTSPRALKDISENSDLATAYLFALVATGTINAGPRTSNVVDKFSEKVDQIYKGVFGDMSSAAQERALFEAIERGQLSGGEGSAIAMPENIYKAQAQMMARQLRDTLTKFKDNTYEALMGSPYARLVDSDSQPLRDLARLISTSSYDSAGRGEGYIGRRNAQFTNYANQVARALGPAVNDEALRRQVWRVMHGVDPMGGASREVQQAVRKLRGAMNRMLEYGRGAGIDIPKRQNYFPWVWNKEALSSRREEITEYMNREEFAPHWDALMEKSLRENATTTADGGVEVTQVTREEFIQKRIDDLLGSEGVGHGLQNESNSPGFRFMNARDLNFLESQTDAAGRAELSSFFEQDLNTTMLRYVSSLVKRAEATRQFGEKGQKVDELLARAKAEGAPDNLIEVGRGFVNAALGMHGTKTRDFLDNLAATQPLPEVIKKMLRKPDVGVMNENTKKMYGWLITYENYRLLALSVFSSFVDPLATGVRASSLPILGKAMNEARRSMWQATKGNTDELMSMAEALGTIDRAMVSEELTAEYTGHQFEGKAKGLNDALFKWNGVESVTKFSRLVATAGADAFIRKHANSGTEQSTAYLDELGISKDDVREVNGRLKFMTEEEYNSASRSERDREDRMKQAVRRFVDSANVRPDPAKRPLYLSDPHFALVGHLKMFAFAFHETVIKRVAAEAKNGNLTPAVLLAGTFVPMMLMADMLRDMIKYGEPEAPYKEGWTLVEHIDNAIKRAGLYGRDEITADIVEPLFKGNFTQAATEALGPTATHIRKTSEWGPGVQDLPLQNLYKNWI